VWLLEGLLTLPDLVPKDRRELRRLRRAAVLRALRTQAGRILQRRWTPELAAYLAFRTGSALGKRPRLYDELDEQESAEAQRLPARG